jgi:hypothetical protein
METAKLLVDLIGKLIWPVTTIAIVLLFRKHVVGLIPHIKKVKAAGVELTIQQKIRGIADEVVENKFASNESVGNLQEIIYQADPSIEKISHLENDDAGNDTLLAFTANKSFEKNLEYNIYYDPATRNHNSPFKYIGLYKEGTISAVGKVVKIVYCNYVNGKLVGTYGEDITKLKSDEYERIKGIIEKTEIYDLQEGCRFFLVDKFHETHFSKLSAYPLRAKKYIWLDEVEGFKAGMKSEKLAEILKDKDWE